jgi:hypothetical protein
VVGSGVGAVLIGINNDADLDGTVSLDNLLVEVLPVFEDDFEGGTTAAWDSVVR